MRKGFTPHLLWDKKDSAYLDPLKKGGGFTLVEMLVAMSIFVMVVTIISGLFVQAIRGQRRNLAYQELLDQTSYVMEYMSRSVRMAMKDDIAIWGYPVPIAPGCLTADKANYEFVGDCLKFRNYKDECQYFCLQGTTLVVATTTPGVAPVSFTDLTSPGLDVLSFNVTDPSSSWQQPPADNNQPLVEIFLEIEGREKTSIRIRTSISQRNLDTRK